MHASSHLYTRAYSLPVFIVLVLHSTYAIKYQYYTLDYTVGVIATTLRKHLSSYPS